MSLELPFGIRPVKALANLDERFGPHSSIEKAELAIAGTKKPGLEVRIIENNRIEEYYVNLAGNLVRKPRGGSGTGIQYFEGENIEISHDNFISVVGLELVAHTGKYSDLRGIPTRTSEFINDGEDGVHPFITHADLYKGNVVLNGSFFREQDLDYYVWADKYIINNSLRTEFISDTVTLSPPDTQFDRIDVIVINDDNTFSVVEGTPSENAVKPKIDNIYQVELTFVLVRANEIPNNDFLIVYDENLGFTGGESDATSSNISQVILDNTEEAYRNNKSIKFYRADKNSSVNFYIGDRLSSENYNKFVGYALFKVPNEYAVEVNFTLEGEIVKSIDLMRGTALGSGIVLGSWYPFVINLNSLGEPFEFDAIEVINKRANSTFYIDYIFLQEDESYVPGPSIERTSQLINDGEFGTGKFIEEVDLEGYIQEGPDSEEKLEYISIKSEDPENRENTIYELRTRFNLVQNTEYLLFKANGNKKFDEVEAGDVVEGFMIDGLVQVFGKGIYSGTGDINDINNYELIYSYEVDNSKSPASVYNRLFTVKGSEEIDPPPFSEYEPFILEFNTELEGKTDNTKVELPLHPEGNYDFIVNWGDGTTSYIRYYGQGDTTHNYTNPGIYTVSIRGVFEGIVGSATLGDNDISKITKVIQFGDMKLGNKGEYFRNARNLSEMANDLDSPETTNYNYAWHNNHNLLEFPVIDLSNATHLWGTWRNCRFTQFPLLNTSNVTNFNEAWQDCINLVEFPLLDTSSGINFQQTWKNNRALTSFPLINTSNAVYFNRTWQQCDLLPEFPSIDTSNVVQFQETWNLCRSLPTFPWIDTSKADRMYNCWSHCTNMGTFPDLDVSNVKDFTDCWNKSGILIDNVRQFIEFKTYKMDKATKLKSVLFGSKIPTEDYDRILKRLAEVNNSDVITGPIDFGDSTYSEESVAYRNILINERGLDIQDGGPQ